MSQNIITDKPPRTHYAPGPETITIGCSTPPAHKLFVKKESHIRLLDEFSKVFQLIFIISDEQKSMFKSTKVGDLYVNYLALSGPHSGAWCSITEWNDHSFNLQYTFGDGMKTYTQKFYIHQSLLDKEAKK